MEMFSLHLSNSPEFVRKEAHHQLHLGYLHSEKTKQNRKKLVYNQSINCPKTVLQVLLNLDADSVH